MAASHEPRPARAASLPGYFPEGPYLLPWAWAESRLKDARNYWIGTTTPGARRPHARPVWGVWLNRMVCFSSGSRIVTNLRANPEVTVHLESGNEVVILEGIAEFRSDKEALEPFVAAYNAKYNWDFTVEAASPIVAVRPRVAFGWLCDPTGLDRGALFEATGTKWLFE